MTGVDKKKVNAVIAIIDGRSSTKIATELGNEAYEDRYICELQKCYRSILASARLVEQNNFNNDHVMSYDPINGCLNLGLYKLHENFHARISGDEFCMMLYSYDLAHDVRTAVFLVVETLMRWIQRIPDIIMEKITDGVPLSAGIHCGEVIFRKRQLLSDQPEILPEGIAFNYAKKAQHKIKDIVGAHTKIAVSNVVEKILKENGQLGVLCSLVENSIAMDGFEIKEIEKFSPYQFVFSNVNDNVKIADRLCNLPVLHPSLALLIYHKVKKDYPEIANKLKDRYRFDNESCLRDDKWLKSIMLNNNCAETSIKVTEVIAQNPTIPNKQ